MAKMTADTRLMRNRTSLRMLKLGGKCQTDRFQLTDSSVEIARRPRRSWHQADRDAS